MLPAAWHRPTPQPPRDVAGGVAPAYTSTAPRCCRRRGTGLHPNRPAMLPAAWHRPTPEPPRVGRPHVAGNCKSAKQDTKSTKKARRPRSFNSERVFFVSFVPSSCSSCPSCQRFFSPGKTPAARHRPTRHRQSSAPAGSAATGCGRREASGTRTGCAFRWPSATERSRRKCPFARSAIVQRRTTDYADSRRFLNSKVFSACGIRLSCCLWSRLPGLGEPVRRKTFSGSACPRSTRSMARRMYWLSMPLGRIAD